MLSYQHLYHAGNAADLHKHALLAWMMAYLAQKPKPLSYLETHAGRGLYDLSAPEARKTAEADSGIRRAERAGWLPEAHPLRAAIDAVRTRSGPDAYPGSPLIAGHFLRLDDNAHLAELHPGECAALREAAPFARIYPEDGFAMLRAQTPPTPRRGLALIDPPYEVKEDYARVPKALRETARKWNVGILALWYPILAAPRHGEMLATLKADHPEALCSEIRFAPARKSHGMVGSGMFVINPPWGLETEAARLESLF